MTLRSGILEFFFGHKWAAGMPYEYNGAYCIDYVCEWCGSRHTAWDRYKIPESQPR